MKDYMPLPSHHVIENNIPPRFQWNENGGYCGEVSMISAGLYYGQYLSQFDMRAIASPGQGQGPGAQLLLGVNAHTAAGSVRLAYEVVPPAYSQDSRAFISWVKQHVAAGHPVIIGVLNNINLLGENKNHGSYDHIVPVIGFGSDHGIIGHGYDDRDVILFSDNGLYTPGNSVPYYHQFRMNGDAMFDSLPFLNSTENADNPDGNIYTLLELPKYIGTGNYHNYGIAITGPADPDKETRPVRIDTNLNYEWPQISGTKDAPEPMPLILTITVSGLTPGTTYNLYKYCDENDVPVRNFNADAKAKNNPPWQVIKNPPGSTWGTSHPIQSNEKFFLRCVPA